MTWRELSDLDKREIANYYISNTDIHHDIRQSYIGEKYGAANRTVRRWLERLRVTQSPSDKLLSEHPQYIAAKNRRVPHSKFYLVGWEQNKTPIVEKLWFNILAYADFLGGVPVIIQGRYQNPTSLWKDKLSNEGWSVATNDYQYNSRIRLHPYLDVLGELKVTPTAVNPLTSKAGLTGINTGIIGHPKLHLETSPMPKTYRDKIMCTTGAITLPNYTESGAGVTAEGKHKLGFTLVEIRDEELFHIRQIEADEQGDFYDLFFQVKDGKVTTNHKSLGIIFGDTHVGVTSEEILQKNKELINLLNPDKVVYHDILDGVSVNNHIHKRPLEQYERYKKGDHLIRKEFSKLIEFLHSVKRDNTYIVRSNHDTRFERYVESMDWKRDIANAEEYIDMAKALLSGEADDGIIAWKIRQEFGDKYFKCLGLDDSLIVGKYEVGMHGHIGTNGSRGSLSTFNRIPVPTITAHSHTTARKDDTLSVGTNTEYNLGYNDGPSNWLKSNVIVHPNGIAQQVIFVRGEYTTLTDRL